MVRVGDKRRTLSEQAGGDVPIQQHIRYEMGDVLRYYVNDVFGTNDSHIIGKYGKLKETIFDEFSTSKISLTVRYKFNTTRSKYKGTGAEESQKNRM